MSTTAWITVPCLLVLCDEFNTIAPKRAKGADGTVGDLAHQGETSDHNPDETGSVPIHDADHVNEVHALDITNDLREPGLDLEDAVQHILARCRSGAERRLRYIIFNRRIWQAKNGWVQEAYHGTSDPHTGHAHFSASYDTDLEASTASWHLEDIAMPSAEEIAKAVWDYRLDVNVQAGQAANPQPAGGILRYGSSEHHAIRDLAAAAADQAGAAVRALAARGDDVDEQAIVVGVLAGLSPEKIAAAIPQDFARQVADLLATRLAA